MAVTIRFVDAAPVPETVTGLSPFAPTILKIAPCLADTGKRLLDADQLYRLFLALVDGQLPVPVTPFGNAQVITAPGNVVIPFGINYVPVRQAVPQAIAITLPAHPVQGYTVLIKDSLGVCFANNFTINTSDGTLIDRLATYVFINAFQGQIFVFDGTGWGVVA